MYRALVVLVLLAGCSGGEAPDDVPPPARGLGTISGVVVDETVMPIAGAHVQLRSGHNATSGPDGAFVISDLEPGAYFIEASKEGHETVQTSVDVAADQVVRARLMLPILPSPEPYHRTAQFKLHHVGSIPLVTARYLPPAIPIDGPFESVVYESDWSDSALVLYPLNDEPYRHRLHTGDGAWERSGRTGTPAVVTYNGTGYDGAPELELVAYPYDHAGVALEAHAEVFISLFYRAPAPEGWSIMEGTGTPG